MNSPITWTEINSERFAAAFGGHLWVGQETAEDGWMLLMANHQYYEDFVQRALYDSLEALQADCDAGTYL